MLDEAVDILVQPERFLPVTRLWSVRRLPVRADPPQAALPAREPRHATVEGFRWHLAPATSDHLECEGCDWNFWKGQDYWDIVEGQGFFSQRLCTRCFVP